MEIFKCMNSILFVLIIYLDNLNINQKNLIKDSFIIL